MDELIEGLFDYARVDTRGEPLEPVDLSAVVDDVLAALRHRLEETDADVRVEAVSEVRGDARQLRQVVQNLLDDALESSGESPPRVTIAAERRGQEAVVSVSDEGVGVDPDDAERLFEVFERGDGGRDADGPGIGLALCERIADRHGGDVWLDSDPGAGTTVSFTRPAADGDG